MDHELHRLLTDAALSVSLDLTLLLTFGAVVVVLARCAPGRPARRAQS